MDKSLLLTYRTQWREYILKNLLYPNDTFFVDFPGVAANVDSVFMFAGFTKPGKHRVIIYDPCSETGQPEWYMRDFFVEERQEPIPKFIKMVEEVKVKEKVLNSVLKEWKKDTSGTYKKIVQYDQQFWKVQKYIKDPDEYEEFN